MTIEITSVNRESLVVGRGSIGQLRIAASKTGFNREREIFPRAVPAAGENRPGVAAVAADGRSQLETEFVDFQEALRTVRAREFECGCSDRALVLVICVGPLPQCVEERAF